MGTLDMFSVSELRATLYSTGSAIPDMIRFALKEKIEPQLIVGELWCPMLYHPGYGHTANVQVVVKGFYRDKPGSRTIHTEELWTLIQSVTEDKLDELLSLIGKNTDEETTMVERLKVRGIVTAIQLMPIHQVHNIMYGICAAIPNILRLRLNEQVQPYLHEGATYCPMMFHSGVDPDELREKEFQTTLAALPKAERKEARRIETERRKTGVKAKPERVMVIAVTSESRIALQADLWLLISEIPEDGFKDLFMDIRTLTKTDGK
ncbi:MAG: hypothetical protein ABL951_04030 [Alphaproteobacteria bacterium]